MKKSASLLLTIIITLLVIVFPYTSLVAQSTLTIKGKGMYLWQLWNANGGGKNLDPIINKLRNIGTAWLVIKIGDGDSYYNSPGHYLYDWAAANYGNMDSVIAIFHSNGIKLLAYQYVYVVPHEYGNSATETDVANSILDVKGIDGLIIDAETEFDTSETREAAAQAYCDSIRAHHPGAFIGLTSFARVDGHNTFPWRTFLNNVDVNMPQAYWAARPTTVENELSLMNSQFTYWINEWVGMGDSAVDKPIMPLGQGEKFNDIKNSNDVEQGDIADFCRLCQSTYNYPGVSLWEYNQIDSPYIWNEYATAWQVTEISKQPVIPIQNNLYQNYPNPFNPTTTIKYSIPYGDPQNVSSVQLKVYDMLGNEVATIVNEKKRPGNYFVKFNASSLSSGVYYYQIHAGNFTQTRKMILLK
jgi:Secretion system C-terminal sorting domain